jgi:hypothetical protein
MDEPIPTLPLSSRLALKEGRRGEWEDWDYKLFDAGKAMVDNINANTPETSPTYILHISPAYAEKRRTRRVLLAMLVCEPKTPSVCRNRNFWGSPGIDPVVFADVALRNTLLDRPTLRKCRYRTTQERYGSKGEGDRSAK